MRSSERSVDKNASSAGYVGGVALRERDRTSWWRRTGGPLTLTVAAGVARSTGFWYSTNFTTLPLVLSMMISVLHLCKADGRRRLFAECSVLIESEVEMS